MTAIWMLAPLLVLLMSWDMGAARRHHLKPANRNDNRQSSDNISSVWGPFANDYLNGIDELDWSRDPRRVVPEVYSKEASCYPAGSQFSSINSMIGEVEGQEWPAGLLKGDRLKPKSRLQLLSCAYNLGKSDNREAFSDYLRRNPILLDSELPMSQCSLYKDRNCKKTEHICKPGSWMIEPTSMDDYPRDPKKIDKLDNKGRLKLERMLRSRGPFALLLENSRETKWEHDIHNRSVRSSRNVDDCAWWPHRVNMVLLVGYGHTEDGLKYLKFKESRGPEWGDRGYGYIKFRPQLDCSHIEFGAPTSTLVPC